MGKWYSKIRNSIKKSRIKSRINNVDFLMSNGGISFDDYKKDSDRLHEELNVCNSKIKFK